MVTFLAHLSLWNKIHTHSTTIKEIALDLMQYLSLQNKEWTLCWKKEWTLCWKKEKKKDFFFQSLKFLCQCQTCPLVALLLIAPFIAGNWQSRCPPNNAVTMWQNDSITAVMSPFLCFSKFHSVFPPTYCSPPSISMYRLWPRTGLHDLPFILFPPSHITISCSIPLDSTPEELKPSHPIQTVPVTVSQAVPVVVGTQISPITQYFAIVNNSR